MVSPSITRLVPRIRQPVPVQWRTRSRYDGRTDAQLSRLLDRAGISSGRVLEIGAGVRSRGPVFGRGFSYHQFDYRRLDLVHSDAMDRGDVQPLPVILDGVYDVVISVDVLEHVDRPWLAAAEISRILAPGGLAYTSTSAGWGGNPCPAGFQPLTPDALACLFADLTVLDQGFAQGFGRDFGQAFGRDERHRGWRRGAMTETLLVDTPGARQQHGRVFHAGIKPGR